MQFGFSSMGAPELPLRGQAALAARHGLAFLELRVLAGSLDLPGYFAAHPGEAEEVRAAFPHCGIRVINSGLSLALATEEQVGHFYREAALADALGAPYVRVFGGPPGETGRPDEATFRAAAATAGRCRAELERRGSRAEMLLETHDVFSSSRDCVRLGERMERPLAILWDSHHTWRLAGESPAESWAILGSLVREVHYKDSVARPGAPHGYVYTRPGAGVFPTAELLALLRRENFAGGVALEWEKLWCPELEPLEAVLPDFRAVMEGQGAGIPAGGK